MTRVDLDAVRAYTLARQTAEGGFCFYSDPAWAAVEPNAPDTWAAIEILQRLETPLPRPFDCAAWLRAQQDASGGFAMPIIGHAVLLALHRLDLRPRRSPDAFIRRLAAACGLSQPPLRLSRGWLTAALRATDLWRLQGLPIEDLASRRVEAALAALKAPGGGYGRPGPSLIDTARALEQAEGLALPPPADVLAYARACERAPYGFNLTPDATSSSLEAQRAGLVILGRFGERPAHPQAIRSFVAACQRAGGGFGRAPGAIARLDDTWRAIEILQRLGP